MEKQINNLPYSISDDGTVRNTNRGTIKKITFDRSGYGKVLLYNKAEDTVEQYYVHQLVAEYFLPKPSGLDEPVVAFIDHDKTNITAENLRWIDRADLNAENHIEGLYNTNKVKVELLDSADGLALSFNSVADACKYIVENTGRIFPTVWCAACRIKGSGKLYNRFQIIKNDYAAESPAGNQQKNN